MKSNIFDAKKSTDICSRMLSFGDVKTFFEIEAQEKQHNHRPLVCLYPVDAQNVILSTNLLPLMMVQDPSSHLKNRN